MHHNSDDIGLIVIAPYDDVLGLFSMWVSPDGRMKGAGGALVDAGIQWAIRQGVGRLLLDVGDEIHPAIALYESRGFRPTGLARTLPAPREYVSEHQRELTIKGVSRRNPERHP